MPIADVIHKFFPELNDVQKSVIGHINGPLLVIAGPGSGKTHCLVLRALNLLLLKLAQPREIILCTFTEKAAFEMRDRVYAAAKTIGYDGDLSGLVISTIHGLCNKLLIQHRHKTELGNNYETLDELTQLLFIFDHFNEIVGEPQNNHYLNRWTTRWTTINGIRTYFDKITEELIDPNQLLLSPDPFTIALGKSYLAYTKLLYANNRVDFSHLQSIVFDLLGDSNINEAITKEIKYILVDEYQDTNYIQEQLLLSLSSRLKNLVVVGDEDQSLYRFRGGTVRNILEFPDRIPACEIKKLTTNYRSHRAIVDRYDFWMKSQDWSNANGRPFRFDKTIKANDECSHPDYPAVLSIWGQDNLDEAERFADLVDFLKTNKVIRDYNQVALLLHSVREDHSKPYIAALERKNIPAFCPRARGYFSTPEVQDLVASFALILGWYGTGRGEVSGAVKDLADYVDKSLILLGRRFSPPHQLAVSLRYWTEQIIHLEKGESLDMRLADYFYHLLALDPFKTAIQNENAARNLAIFSNLLNVFQNYYHYTVITHRNREFMRLHFFNSFLRLLFDGGINEYEDPNQPFPKGYVQVMTIHQSKGLEFPVVAVGSLSNQISSQKQVDRDLCPFYHRSLFEPEDRITAFDRMRLHYVAFSRPQKILVLTSHETPKDHFSPIWQGLSQWPYVQKELLAAQRFEIHDRMPFKKSYSFTGDLKIYETCPRQYQFFREYDYCPSRSAVIFFGLLVHQTIEEIHRVVLDGDLHLLDQPVIREMFDRNFRLLCLSDVRPIGETAKETAFTQVMDYFRQNQNEMRRVIETEVDVSLEKDNYILSGKIDLLMGSDGKLELLDFKTSPRPKESQELIKTYERQLCTYAHILERRHGKRVDRMMLYWTSEANKQNALMTLPYDPDKVREAGQYFDQVVSSIQGKYFKVNSKPEAGICKECDLKPLCNAEGF